MNELHLNRKDFRLDWYSGTGKGGQHRNKHQNCCRITHIETGISAAGTASRERGANQRAAFNVLAARLLAHFNADSVPERRETGPAIRNYHAVRNEVHDKASGLKLPYREVVEKGDIGSMIDARAKATRGDAVR